MNPDTIEKILDAAERPLLPVVPIRQHLGSNGKWYSIFGVPHGVTLTDETRVAGYAYRAENGTTVGRLFPTAEEAQKWQEDHRKAQREEFRTALLEMTPAEYRRQEIYWLKITFPGVVTCE